MRAQRQLLSAILPLLAAGVLLSGGARAQRGDLFQPLSAQAQRVSEALTFLGSPISKSDSDLLAKAVKSMDAEKAVEDIQKALDPYCLYLVNINPESRVKVAAG